MNTSVKILLLSLGAIALAACAHGGLKSDVAGMNSSGVANGSEPFSEFNVCPAQWNELLDEWSASKSADARNLEQVYAITAQSSDTSRIGVALRRAWTVSNAPLKEGEFPTEGQWEFISSLSGSLREDCQALGWMAAAVSELPPEHWLSKLQSENSRPIIEPGDQKSAMNFIRRLIGYPYLAR